MDQKGVNGESRIENWAKHKFECNTVLTRSDYNVKDFDWTKINAFSLQRRISDYMNQAKASEIRRDIFYGHPEKYLYPAPGKESDMILMVNEFKKTILDYQGIEGAEVSAMVMLDTIVEWNYNMCNKNIAGWIPGLVTVFKWMPQIQDGTVAVKNGFLGLMEHLPGGKKFVKEYKLHEKHPSEWPTNMAALVSKDVKMSRGPAGNAWDEIRVAGIFEGVEELKMASSHDAHKYFQKMQQKYMTTIPFRFLLTIPRKYWWAVPVATVGLALMTSDDKKSHH
jgi:hypothetical protein